MATLYMVYGPIASGKSTWASSLGSDVLVFSEDRWMATLYPGEVTTMEDFVRASRRVRQALTPTLVGILERGVSVALDFQANTPRSRAWMREVFESAGADHELHILETPHEVCKARLRARNALGEHPYQTTAAEFDQFAAFMVPPSPAEGFHIVRHPYEPE